MRILRVLEFSFYIALNKIRFIFAFSEILIIIITFVVSFFKIGHEFHAFHADNDLIFHFFILIISIFIFKSLFFDWLLISTTFFLFKTEAF
jgi:hypothetical protein